MKQEFFITCNGLQLTFILLFIFRLCTKTAIFYIRCCKSFYLLFSNIYNFALNVYILVTNNSILSGLLLQKNTFTHQTNNFVCNAGKANHQYCRI